MRRQCELLGLARSSLYYEAAVEPEENQRLMRWIDEQYTRTPFYGSRRMAVVLQQRGWPVNRKRVARLMALMGLEAIYPKRNLSRAAAGHRIYPYLLRGVKIARVGQVWSSDITYIRLRGGFIYLVAVLDWFSRYVLSWRCSNSLEGVFCREALQAAMVHGFPEIFNSDQGSQFTCQEFHAPLLRLGVRVSMDGRGRALDNVFTERLWRSVKYEEVYLNDYAGVAEAERGIGAYFDFYNHTRPHQALGYATPAQIFSGRAAGPLG